MAIGNRNRTANDTAPPTSAAAVTPSDSTVLNPPTRALWVGGAGDVAVLMLDDAGAVTLKAVPAGTLIPCVAQKVMATNTTATNITALF